MKISRREFLSEIFLFRQIVAVSAAASAVTARVSGWRQRLTSSWSDDFRNFMRNLAGVIGAALMMACGAMLYARWASGEDIGPVILSLSIIALGALLRRKKPIQAPQQQRP